MSALILLDVWYKYIFKDDFLWFSTLLRTTFCGFPHFQGRLLVLFEIKNVFFNIESTYKKCLREEWGKFTGYQLLSSFWLKVARTDEDGNTTRWDRGTLPIRNLYSKWGMLRFGRMRKVTNWIWILWFIVSYWWVT